jgi:rhodanese-related sulfurtransferase
MDLFTQLFNQPAINQLYPAQVQAMDMQLPKPFLLDVRTPQEYDQGHISGAVLISLNDLSNQFTRIPKDREVICICHSGSRSSTAARLLKSQGYKVSNMKGGMASWVMAGLPVKRGMSK